MRLPIPRVSLCHSRESGNLYDFIDVDPRVKPEDDRYGNLGFTLIELLVVAGIIAVISAMTIPSYVSFSRSQEVQQASANLKNVLRDTQNRAAASAKPSSCTDADTLLGFFATLTSGNNSNTLAVGGICGSTVFNNSSPTFTTSSNIQIQGFFNANSSCSQINLSSVNLTVLFKPLAGGVQFFDGDTSALPLSFPLSLSKLGIKLANGQGTDFLIISSSGDINEKSTCP